MRTAWLPALGLFVLAPVCAEYLWGYDDSTGHPATLVGNLIVFSPLYGAPALLIREAARRYALGWPGLLLMAAAFGVLQAGVVDQSMWSSDYRDIPYWHDMAAPSYVAAIGLSVYLAVAFVGGHVVLSIGSPTAIVETLARRRRHEPWLGRITLPLVVVLYAGASALVMKDAYDTGEATATAAQLAASALVAVGLVVAAVLVGRRPAMIVPGTVPRPGQVAGAAFVAMVAVNAIPPSRLGTALVVLVELGFVAGVWLCSHRGDWDQRHVLALAAGAVTAAGCYAFLTDPIGDVSDAQKYGHNIALLVLMAGLAGWAARRTRVDRAGPPTMAPWV